MEGSSLVILKEELEAFKGKKITAIGGNTTVDVSDLKGKRLDDIRTWGKHLLLSVEGKHLRIHFMLFGTYRINDPKDANPRLLFKFRNGCVYFYACSVKENAPIFKNYNRDHNTRFSHLLRSPRRH